VKYQDLDLQELLHEWEQEFEESIDDFNESLDEIKRYRASPNMFDKVVVQAYGDYSDLRDLGQTIIRGENNVLISVYDETIKESVMKAIMLHDPDLECSIEGKYISVKMAKTRAENRDVIVNQAKTKYNDFKQDLAKRSKSMV